MIYNLAKKMRSRMILISKINDIYKSWWCCVTSHPWHRHRPGPGPSFSHSQDIKIPISLRTLQSWVGLIAVCIGYPFWTFLFHLYESNLSLNSTMIINISACGTFPAVLDCDTHSPVCDRPESIIPHLSPWHGAQTENIGTTEVCKQLSG